jgi:hypothetical protein
LLGFGIDEAPAFVVGRIIAGNGPADAAGTSGFWRWTLASFRPNGLWAGFASLPWSGLTMAFGGIEAAIFCGLAIFSGLPIGVFPIAILGRFAKAGFGAAGWPSFTPAGVAGGGKPGCGRTIDPLPRSSFVGFAWRAKASPLPADAATLAVLNASLEDPAAFFRNLSGALPSPSRAGALPRLNASRKERESLIASSNAQGGFSEIPRC